MQTKWNMVIKMNKLKETLAKIGPINDKVAVLAQERLDSAAKPQGSLGVLEDCAKKYCAARGDINAIIANPTILTFAGDHGIADEGVSAFPQEVTPQMVANFAEGGAAINVLTKHVGADLKVINIGVASECNITGVIQRNVALGTKNFTKGPAMSIYEVEQALIVGIEEAENAINAGSSLLGTGDMGIANTTPSAALYSIFTDIEPENIVGRGTGITDDIMQKKIEVVKKGIEVNKELLTSPINILAALGGLEIAGICGAILGAVANKVPIVIDGFISGAAAITAYNINKDVLDYCYFSHLSAEAGHINIMENLGICPILDLNLRLGEGTGAALAFNIIEAGMKIMNEMATFSEAGVTDGT